jgi:hypothetical protein
MLGPSLRRRVGWHSSAAASRLNKPQPHWLQPPRTASGPERAPSNIQALGEIHETTQAEQPLDGLVDGPVPRWDAGLRPSTARAQPSRPSEVRPRPRLRAAPAGATQRPCPMGGVGHCRMATMGGAWLPPPEAASLWSSRSRAHALVYASTKRASSRPRTSNHLRRGDRQHRIRRRPCPGPPVGR